MFLSRFNFAAATCFALAAVFVSPLSSSEPKLRLASNFVLPGTVAVLEFRVKKKPLILRWQGLDQEGRFFKLSGRRGRYIALVAVALTEKPAQRNITVEWGEPGRVRTTQLRLEIARGQYPASKQPLLVKKFRSKLYKYLPQEKRHLKKAWAKAGGDPRWRGFFKRPLPVSKEFRISSVFGKKRTYNNGEAAWSHKGVDYAAPLGTAVLSPNAGVVVLAKSDLKAYGGAVVVGHGQDLASTFLHMSKVSVRVGQRVKKGTKLGEVGAGGIATGAHLHWQMTLRGYPVQPQQWLEKSKKLSPFTFLEQKFRKY